MSKRFAACGELPGKEALKKRGELVGARREFLSSIANLMKLHIYDWIDQPTRHYFSVPARWQSERGNNGYAFIGLHHGNLRIQEVDRNALPRYHACLGQMLVHNLLNRAKRLRARGLVEVGAEGRMSMWRGGSPDMSLLRTNFKQLRGALLDAHYISEQEFDHDSACLDDPDFMAPE